MSLQVRAFLEKLHDYQRNFRNLPSQFLKTMHLYCPICFSTLSTSEVKRSENLVICNYCKQDSPLTVTQHFSLQLTELQGNRYKKQEKVALFEQYPPLPPQSSLKIKESLTAGEKMLEVQYKQVWWVILPSVSVLVGLGVLFFLFPVEMLYLNFLREELGWEWGLRMCLTLFIILLVFFQFVQNLLAFFIPEKIHITRGKLIYTSIWGKESSYFEEEIANIFPDIVITKTKNGESKTPVLALALGEDNNKNIFNDLPENEARWLSGLLKKYLQETGIGS